MKYARYIFGIGSWLVAGAASGQIQAAGESFRSLTVKAGTWVSNTVFPILVAIAVLAFFYNLVFFISIWTIPRNGKRSRSTP